MVINPEETERVEPLEEAVDRHDEGGVDLSLIRWMLDLTPEDRLRAAQDMVDTVWALRNAERAT